MHRPCNLIENIRGRGVCLGGRGNVIGTISACDMDCIIKYWCTAESYNYLIFTKYTCLMMILQITKTVVHSSIIAVTYIIKLYYENYCLTYNSCYTIVPFQLFYRIISILLSVSAALCKSMCLTHTNLRRPR